MVKRTDTTATYLYCLVHGKKSPSLARPPRGLPGAGPVRLLDAGDGFWLAVADAPLVRYGSEPIERGLRDLKWVSACAMAHESVVEHFGRAGTVIPMKLFTLFSSDERAATHVRRTRKRLLRLITRVMDRQEWGVRLSLDEARGLRGLAARSPGDGRRLGAGTGFLVRKKQERDSVRRLAERARAEADRIFGALARRADDARRQTPPPGDAGIRVLLDAAFLVRARRSPQFRATAHGLARRLAGEGYALTLSGPWPPYTFVAEPA